MDDNRRMEKIREALLESKAGAMHPPRDESGFRSWRSAFARDVEFLINRVDDLDSQLDMARQLINDHEKAHDHRIVGMLPNDPMSDDPQPRMDD